MMKLQAAFTIFILSCFLTANILGHGAMVKPITWFDTYPYRDYYGMESGKMCDAGFHLNTNKLCERGKNNCNNLPYPGRACFWFNNFTKIPERITSPTLEDRFRTFRYHRPDQKYSYDWTSRNPWRAPGSASIYSGCGVGGGNPHGCFDKDGQPHKCAFDSYGKGPKAENFYPYINNIHTTLWKAGSNVEVAWGITANHGGGYIYRLCKVPPVGVSGITENCFQNNILKFVGNYQWLQYGKDRSNRYKIHAERTSVGTHPPGSTWTKNPIPACKNYDGGFFSFSKFECEFQHNKTQFPPPIIGKEGKKVFGYGGTFQQTVPPFQFSIVDEVKVPSDLVPGHYVLSWRWDCEQTPQVWNTCASIRIT